MATTTSSIDRGRLLRRTDVLPAAAARTARRVRGPVPARHRRDAARRAELVPGRRPAPDLPQPRRRLAGLGRRRQRVRRLPQRLRRHVRRAREPGDRRGGQARASTQGTHFAAPTDGSIVVAEELRRRFGLPQWRFTNSGTESTMDAVHLARGATGRDLIVKIEGSYHGHHDAVMVSVLPAARGARRRATSPSSVPFGARLPAGDRPSSRAPIPFNDADALERVLDELDGQVAGADPRAGDDEHQRSSRRGRATSSASASCATEHGVDARSSTRSRPARRSRAGGATERFGVTPDVVCLAKAICGGLSGRRDRHDRRARAS